MTTHEIATMRTTALNAAKWMKLLRTSLPYIEGHNVPCSFIRLSTTPVRGSQTPTPMQWRGFAARSWFVERVERFVLVLSARRMRLHPEYENRQPYSQIYHRARASSAIYCLLFLLALCEIKTDRFCYLAGKLMERAAENSEENRFGRGLLSSDGLAVSSSNDVTAPWGDNMGIKTLITLSDRLDHLSQVDTT